MKFKYNNKIYETPNLEKKLKRMKLTLEDIEILQEEINKPQGNSEWEYKGTKSWKYYKHPNSDKIHCCLIDIGTKPDKHQLFRNLIEMGMIDYVNELEEYDKQMDEKTN